MRRPHTGRPPPPSPARASAVLLPLRARARYALLLCATSVWSMVPANSKTALYSLTQVRPRHAIMHGTSWSHGNAIDAFRQHSCSCSLQHVVGAITSHSPRRHRQSEPSAEASLAPVLHHIVSSSKHMNTPW